MRSLVQYNQYLRDIFVVGREGLSQKTDDLHTLTVSFTVATNNLLFDADRVDFNQRESSWTDVFDRSLCTAQNVRRICSRRRNVALDGRLCGQPNYVDGDGVGGAGGSGNDDNVW